MTTPGEGLRALLAGDPAEPIVIGAGIETTRGDVVAWRDRLAVALRAAGLEHRAIGVLMPNTAPTIAAWFAVWDVPATFVPLNPRVPAAELRRAAATTGLSALVTSSDAPELLGGEPVAVESTPFRIVPLAPPEPRVCGPNEAIVQFTSGTTGQPKAVVLRHDTIAELLDSVIASLRGGRSGNRATMPNLVPMSLALWAGIYQVLFAFTLGVPVILMEQFEPEAFARLVARHGIRSSVLPPAALVMLINDPNIDTLEPLRYVRCVSAPLSPAHARRFHERFGIAVLNGYGQTELGGEAIGWSAADWKQHGTTKLGAVGRPHDAFEVRVRSDDGSLASAGDIGELEIHSTSALPPADAAMEGRVTADGWLRTGDLARVDDDGFVWIEGRVSAMINRGGLKVFPDEVEERLRALAGVRDAAVAGVPDARLGEVPWAFVVADDASEIDADVVEQWCRAALAPYKVPAGLTIVDELPRNEMGKVLRQELIATVTTRS
jgi:acyl-CoA synthetase (AMP-forming)/AMP-acid ligase II